MVVVVVMLRARTAVLAQIRRAAYPMHPTAAQVGRALDPMHAAAERGVGTEGEEGGGAIDGGGGGGEGGGSGRDGEHGAPRAGGCGGVDGVNVALVEGGDGTVAARGRGGGGGGEEEEAEAGGGGEGWGAGVECVEPVVLLEHVDEFLVAGDGDEGVEVFGHQLVLDHLTAAEHPLDPLLELCHPCMHDIDVHERWH